MSGYDPYDPGGGGRGGRGRRKYVPYGEFEDLQEKMRRLMEAYQAHASEQDAFLFGTDAERRREAFRQNMMGQFRDMMPQVASMLNSGGMNGLGGGGMQQGMGMNPMMGQNPAMMPGMMNGMGGLGMGGMNPAAGAMGQMGMNPGMGMPPQAMAPPFMNQGFPGANPPGGPMGQPRNWHRKGRGPAMNPHAWNDEDMFDEEDWRMRPQRDWGGGGRPPWGEYVEPLFAQH